MKIMERTVQVKDLLTKSNLPASDYVINPYVGCPHGCKYCYACFMKRFTNHSEEWGQSIDIKQEYVLPGNQQKETTGQNRFSLIGDGLLQPV